MGNPSTNAEETLVAGQGNTVLIADDDVVFRRLLEVLLKAAGFDVVASVGFAEAAVAAAAQLRPDLALVDYMMPGRGPAAAEGIGRVSPVTRVVALSGSESPETVRDMLAAGAVTYVLKGTPPSELVEALHQSLAAASPESGLAEIARSLGHERVTVLVLNRDPRGLDAFADEIARIPRLELVGLAQTTFHATTLAGRHRPDLALIDVRMPEGGAKAAADVAAASPGTRVVASTLGHDPVHDLAAIVPDSPAPARTATGRFDRLRQTLARERIPVALQPICSLDDEQRLGYEALARFPGAPQRTPDVWFAEAHRAGLGIELELLAVRSALHALEHLPAHAFLAVNISPQSVAAPGLDALLAEVDPERIVLELTEHAPVDDYAALGARLDELRRSGVRVAVDDCGAGFASLRHVALIGPEFLKLDIVLCRDVREPVRAALTRALVGFASETGATVIAEGIETGEDLAALRELGVSLGQGYLLAPPALL